MSTSLSALMTKLNWQLHTQDLQMHALQKTHRELNRQIQDIDTCIKQTDVHSLKINPDIEINRLNFTTQQQGKKRELITTLKNNEELQHALNEKIRHAKTELKRLEKYLHRHKRSEQEQLQKTENNAMDEWVIQQREL